MYAGWECLQVFEGHTHYVMQVTSSRIPLLYSLSLSLSHSVSLLFIIYLFSIIMLFTPELM